MANAYTSSTSYPIATATFGTTSPVTGSAPSNSDTSDGLSTAGLKDVTVKVSVANGVTLSGAGSLLAYEFDPLIARWFRVPGADLTLSTASVRDLEAGILSISAFSTAQRTSNRISYVPSGVTFSAGSAGVTITMVGTKAIMASNGTGA